LSLPEHSSTAAVVSRTVTLPSLFQVLGVAAAVGRTLQPEDGPLGAEKVAVLSHAAWSRWFSRSPEVLKQSIGIDGQPHRIVGIMPRGFGFPSADTTVWTPLVLASVGRGVHSFSVVARLQPTVPIDVAAQETNTVLSAIRRIRPDPSAAPRFTVTRLQDEQAAPFLPALRILSLAVFLVLLIGCGNVANLVLARGTRRAREMAVRSALGAGRARLIQYVLTECVVLGLLGGLAGLVLAFAAVRLLITVWPSRGLEDDIPSLASFNATGLDPMVVIFIATLSVGTAVVFGLIPALRASRATAHGLTQERWETSALGRQIGWRTSLRSMLVIVQVAVATVLLISGGLLIRSFIKLNQVDLGFSPRDVLTFQVVSPRTGAARDTFNEQLVERLSAGGAPGAYAHQLPLMNGETSLTFRVVGMDEDAARALGPEARALPVSYGYLQAIGIRLVRGRYLNERDGRGSARVVLVIESLARRYFGKEDPVGRSIVTIGPAPWTIVGVVADLRQTALDDPPDPEFYLDFRQMSEAFQQPMYDFVRDVCFVVKTSNPAAMIRSVQATISQLDPDAVMINTETLDTRLRRSQSKPRFYAGFISLVSAAGLVLASIGVYGLVAYSVQQRTREIGIRAALGATTRHLLVLVLLDGVASMVIGTAVGVGGALVATKFLAAALFGVIHSGVPTYVSVAGSLILVGLAASWVPARRAAATSPLVALRAE
jgi:predicted permease